MQAPVGLHLFFNRCLNGRFPDYSLLQDLPTRELSCSIGFLLLKLLVNSSKSASIIEAVLHLEEDGDDIQQDEYILIESRVFPALIIVAVVVGADVADQVRLGCDVHRTEFILHDVDQELGLELGVDRLEGLYVVALEIAEDDLQTLVVNGLDMFERFEAAVCYCLLIGEGIPQLAEILEEGRAHKRLLILINGDLGDLQQEI